MYDYPFFEVEKDTSNRTAILYLNRPEKRNAMNWDFWRDLPAVVDELDQDKDVRVVVIAGRGKSFSTGLDIVEFFDKFKDTLSGDVADRREELHHFILRMQSGMNRIAHSRKPFIAAVHRHCIGGALDLIAACDIRVASKDSVVSLREAKVAIVADMGSLQRLPGIIGMGNTRLMAYTGGDFKADHCERMGLFSQIFDNYETLLAGACQLAAEISANSGIAVRGSKHVLNYVQNHAVDDSLAYVATFNAAYIDSLDFRELGKAFNEKRRPEFL